MHTPLAESDQGGSKYSRLSKLFCFCRSRMYIHSRAQAWTSVVARVAPRAMHCDGLLQSNTKPKGTPSSVFWQFWCASLFLHPSRLGDARTGGMSKPVLRR